MKIKAMHLLCCGKAGKVQPGAEDESKRLGLTDDEVKDLAARGALEIIKPARPAKPQQADDNAGDKPQD